MLTEKQQQLANLMGEISEKHYNAGWLTDLEYILWEAIQFKHDDEGQLEGYVAEPGLVPYEQVITLRLLALQVDGWIYWANDDTNPELNVKDFGETYIPMEHWRARYDRWKSKWRTTAMLDDPLPPGCCTLTVAPPVPALI